MGEPLNKKAPSSESLIFDIQSNPFEDGAIPGVTDLIQPKARPDVTSLSSLSLVLEKTEAISMPTLSLREWGILFELKFASNQGVYRFASAQGHLQEHLLPWQTDLYQSMKFDLNIIVAQKPFEEFSPNSNSFLYEAFGVTPPSFVQIITPEYSNSRIVLISQNSIVSKKEQVIEHFNKG